LVRVVGYKVDKYLNLRLGEKTKGLQEEYHRMGRMTVDKKIFEALLGHVEQALNSTSACQIYGVR
jgi:hypothetical protein